MPNSELPIKLSKTDNPQVDGYRNLALVGSHLLHARSLEIASVWLVKTICHAWDIPVAMIWWHDRDRGVYRLYELVGERAGEMDSILNTVFTAKKGGPVSVVAEKREVFRFLCDEYIDMNKNFSKFRELDITHGAVSPLIYEDRVIGALEFFTKEPLPEQVLEQFEVISQMFSEYVENRTTLWRWRGLAMYAQALTDILTNAQTTTSLATLLTKSIANYCDSIGAIHGRIWMPERDGLVLHGQYGLLEELFEADGADKVDHVTQQALSDGNLVVEHNVSDTYWPGDIDLYAEGVRSVVSLPVKNLQGELLAMITIYMPEHPNEDDTNAMEILNGLGSYLYLVSRAYHTWAPLGS